MLEKRLRIVHVVPMAPGGGTSGFIQRQIDRLTQAGIEGRIVYFAGSAMLYKPFRMYSALARIKDEIKLFCPDIVHAHWGSLLALISAIASIKGPPLIISYRGSDINPVPSDKFVKYVIRQFCSQVAAQRAAGIICMSEELKSRLWIHSDRVKIILDGTDITLFNPRDRIYARRLLDWPEHDKIVLFYAGRNPQVKRLDLAIASITYAQQIIGPIRLEILHGDVPYDQVPLRMNAADCLLMTSDYEGSPNVVREALACNTPVVSVPVGDVRRWLTGLKGTRIADRKPSKLGQALADIITDGIRPNGQVFAGEFSEERSCNLIIDEYNRVLGRN